MAEKHVNSISVNALVDKVNNKIIFADSDEDFIDVLFSFLTIPMGTIIRLTRNQPPTADVGCMNNLYKSVENFDVQRLCTEACKTMLLRPRNAAETHCRSLKLKFDDSEPTRYFLCSSKDCSISKFKLLSHHKGALCGCGGTMSKEIKLPTTVSKESNSAIQDRGVFVKGLTRLQITDDLDLKLPSPGESLRLIKLAGVADDGSTMEARTFDVGVNKVLNLLKCLLVSKTPLTGSLLKNRKVSETQYKVESAGESKEDEKIRVKLMVSKSQKLVCYAEVEEDFVDLLFSFLTLPLGYIVKEMQSVLSEGCVNNLYKSVLDAESRNYLKSEECKKMLVNPKVAPGFRHKNQPLGIEEASHPQYYLVQCLFLNSGSTEERLTTDETLGASRGSGTVLTVMDSKSHYKEGKNEGGFVEGPAMFTVTDDLVITPISPVHGITLLNTLKVPFSDVEERNVRVGRAQASRLLVASFVTKSALTSTFI